MKGTTIAVILALPLFVLTGCREERAIQPPSGGGGGTHGTILGWSGCKTAPEIAFEATASSDMDCIEYTYDDGNLSLKHLNAGFNCCPGEIVADIDIESGIITITEDETEPNCHCLCLFDVDLAISDLPSGQYTIRMVELHLQPGDEPLEFDIDLDAAPTGSHCVGRNHYPWNQDPWAGGPRGSLIHYSGCKTLGEPGSVGYAPPELDCMRCFYYEEGVLVLEHLNAGFNCCPGEIWAEFTIRGDTISIAEHERDALCDCNCLFDIQYEISGIGPGLYTIVVSEPYTEPGDEPLAFQIELSPGEPGFCYCVPRTHYPWKDQYDEQEDHERLAEMAAEIIALVGTPRCSGGDDCRVLPVGAKPCGGPKGYLIASAASESYPDLISLLCMYNCFEHVVNQRYGYCSDCSVPSPPTVRCVGGVCTAAEPRD